MNVLQRREKLKPEPNPDPRMDYVSTLEGTLTVVMRGTTRITVRYVPDRLILTPEGLGRYLTGLESIAWPGLEALATAILDDVTNEVVMRWVQVIVTAPAPDQPGVDAHTVMLEDRQPKWSNDPMLSRLKLL